MKVKMLDAAIAELNEAFAYYNEQSEGLGYIFNAEIKHPIERIVQVPQAWPLLSAHTR